MADEIDDSEVELNRMTGLENSWTGRVLLGLVRSVKLLRVRVNNLQQRVTDLENRP